MATGTMKPEDDPSNPSADHLAMAADLEMIADIRAGARRIKEQKTKYLPQYEKESDKGYRLRLDSTPWRPEFNDALRNLCSKPFTKEVALQGTVPDRIKQISEDIDGQGHNLHEFARGAFTNGVANGVEAIYVTYPDADPTLTATVAAEKESGVRPYWVHICADDIIALYTRKVNGRDIVEHIRIKECVVTRNNFAETKSERVRVIELDALGTPVWTLYEKQKDKDGKETYIEIQSGSLTVPEIPVALLFTGERSGNYRVKPPLVDLANMQMEIYRALSREDEILTYAGSPMLVAKGMNPPAPTQEARIIDNHSVMVDVPAPQITVGPKTVLFAPPVMDGVQSDWDFIQPDAANIEAVQRSVDGKIDHFRRLALQPQMPGSGTVTATSAAIDAAKAHSAIEVWANALKDVLEQAMVFTCQWLKIDSTVEVSVHTDFGVDLQSADEYSNLINMNAKGKLSDDTLWDEGQRRGILGPQFDKDKEPEKIAKDQEGLEPEQQIDPVTGLPIDPNAPPVKQAA